MQDIVRVLRIVEYTGPRSEVENAVSKSVHGERVCSRGLVIKAATIGTYPEILVAGVGVDKTHNP